MDRFCEVCGTGEMVLGDTSTLYCQNCGAQSNQFIEEAFDMDDAHIFASTFVRERGLLKKTQQEQLQPVQPPRIGEDDFDAVPDVQEVIRLTQGLSQSASFAIVKTEDLSQPDSQFGLEYDPTARMSNDELASAIRKSYVSGLQKILQLQLECLVKEFGVTPLICGIAGPIWLRFVASTRVFEKAWAERAVIVAEHENRVKRESRPQATRRDNQADAPIEGDPPLLCGAADAPVEGDPPLLCGAADGPNDGDPALPSAEGDATGDKKKKKKVKQLIKRSIRKKLGPAKRRTSYGRHLSYVWLAALKERIPLSMTLAVSYLSCYIAREPILPTDIRKWAAEGQLPYFAAFVEIAKSAPHHIPNTLGEKQIFPMKPRLMFQPQRLAGARYLELLAGFVAERVGVQLPPVNFHAVCALFLREMGLPVEKFLAYACRLYDWYVPSGLFLSARRTALPTRVYVMAMLIIAMKILYNLDGRPLQQAEEIRTRNRRGGSAAGNEKGSNCRSEAPYTMLTRARANQKASCAEASVDEEQQADPVENVHGIPRVVTSSQKGSFTAPEGGQILGKRKRAMAASGQGEGSYGSGEDVRILGSKFLNESAAFREGQNWEIGDAKELLKLLEAVKTPTRTVNYDEELSKYLKYCQNMFFSGYDLEAGIEPILERFREIYEKHVVKGKSQPVLNSDDEATVGEGIDSRPVPKAETPRSLERAESLERDAPSAGSARPDWGSRQEASKQKKESKGKEKVVPTQVNESGPAPEVDEKDTGTRETGITDMKKAGFCPLPPVADHLAWDDYTRYSFQEPSHGFIPVHEDYFRVLQECAKLTKVHVRALHRCVQRIEKGLLQMESNVDKFLRVEKGLDVVELAKAVKRRKPKRRRDKFAQAENAKSAAEMTLHVRDLSYL